MGQGVGFIMGGWKILKVSLIVAREMLTTLFYEDLSILPEGL